MTPEEAKAEVAKILTAMKSRDAELDVVLKKVEADLTEHKKVQEGTKDAVAKLTEKGAELHGRLHDLEQAVAKAAEKPGRALSLGEQFVADPKLKDYASVAQSSVKSNYRWHTKNITSIEGSAGAGIFSDRLPGVVEEPLRPLSIRALLDPGTTDSNLIEWVKELLFTNNADVVSEGALKPQSDITYELEQVPVRTIAHWFRASKQVLADFKQLATLINGRARWGLKIKEEDQILFGDGTGQNLLGLIPQATPYNTGLSRPGDTYIDTIRHAILQVRLAYYPASGVVMSPTDWHHLELTKDNENRYLIASPTSRTPPMIWGQPVVEADGMPLGDFLVGAFRMAATLFDREQASIMLSTEDQDNFVRNMVTILCEERLALAVSRPAAFVHGEFPAGSTT
jgi:HK97 family phage major capsid protein